MRRDQWISICVLRKLVLQDLTNEKLLSNNDKVLSCLFETIGLNVRFCVTKSPI